MKQQKTESTAQLTDRFLQRTAIGVLVMSIAYATSAAAYLVGEELAETLDKLEMVPALLAVAIILPIFVKFVRLRANRDCATGDAGSYLAEVYKKAGLKAFSFGFVFLVILEPLTKNAFSHLPGNFFVNVILSFLLAVFGLTFLLLSRDDDDEFDDEDETEQQP
jgi:hypothetical protein